MLEKKKIKRITDQIFSFSSADQVEVVITAYHSGLTRFAENRIHQNLTQENVSISVRVVLGKKIGVARTNKRDKKSLEKVVMEAEEIAKNQEPDEYFLSLPKPKRVASLNAFRAQTASFSPLKRANLVARLIKKVEKQDLRAFGALETSVIECGLANSLGILLYHPSTTVELSVVAKDNQGNSGFASQLLLDIGKLKVEAVIQKAIQKAILNKNPIEIKPGRYPVILEAQPVNEILNYMAYLALGARAFHEKRSFLSGQIGKKVAGENITLWDDALDLAGLPMPFDMEGVPKKKIMIIEKGILKGVVYDHYDALKYGKKPTGHGLPAPNTLDALAGHLHLAPGKLTEEDLIKGIKKGLLVSKFWYLNAHHHRELNLTGLTRDGTFLIENGQIKTGVKNLRFTQSIPQALLQVSGIGQETKLEKSWLGGNLVPALRIKNWHFTGVSKL
jgi:PmbA protein